MKKIHYSLYLIAALSLTFFSCSESEEIAAVQPTKDDLNFSYTIDSENPNIVHFVGETSVDTWYTHWNFGDNTGEEGLEATKVFFKQGTYEVRFKIFTEGGTASVFETIEIAQDFQGPDLIKNGGLDGDDFWTVVEISPGVEVEIADGKATWTGGGWGNAAIYQKIDVEANKKYDINMDISGDGMSDCWFEVFVGVIEPQQAVDYSDGGIQIGLNTWEGCGTEAFAGQLIDLACVGEGGSFTWPEAATAYFVIKSGGANLGASGVTIDNIAIRSL